MRDVGLVDEVEQIIRSLEAPGMTQEEQDALWSRLIDGLTMRVRSFPALPTEAPGLSDAAYCIFLHSLASRHVHFRPAWSAAVAQRLGLSADLNNERSRDD